MAQDYGNTATGEKANVTRGDLARFWPEDLVPNTEQYRHGYIDNNPAIQAERDKEIEAMVASLCTEGQLQPVIIRPVSGNRFRIHGGDTRYQAFKRINERGIWPWGKPEDKGRARIECIVKKCSDRDAFGQSITENLERNKLSPIDISNAVQMASEKYQYTDAEIMVKFRQHDPAWLPNMRRLARLPDSLKRQIHLKDMAPSVGYILAEIPEEFHAEVLAEASAAPAVNGHFSIETTALDPWEEEAQAEEERAAEYVIHRDGDATNNTVTNLAIVDTIPTVREARQEAGKASTAKPKKVTARAVTSAAKKRGLLKHKKIANTVAGQREFWSPFAEDRNTGSKLHALAKASLAWISSGDDEQFYSHLLAILKEAK